VKRYDSREQAASSDEGGVGKAEEKIRSLSFSPLSSSPTTNKSGGGGGEKGPSRRASFSFDSFSVNGGAIPLEANACISSPVPPKRATVGVKAEEPFGRDSSLGGRGMPFALAMQEEEEEEV